jgi:hypothetical protein
MRYILNIACVFDVWVLGDLRDIYMLVVDSLSFVAQNLNNKPANRDKN